MKNFMVFFYAHYYPNGGMHDFKGSTETLEEALELLEEVCIDYENGAEHEKVRWYSNCGHIFDLVKEDIIFRKDINNLTGL
jgi:hypothetical protein